jgi:hypothetical protein
MVMLNSLNEIVEMLNYVLAQAFVEKPGGFRQG